MAYTNVISFLHYITIHIVVGNSSTTAWSVSFNRWTKLLHDDMSVGMASRRSMEGQIRSERQGRLLSTGEKTYTILQVSGKDIPTQSPPQSLTGQWFTECGLQISCAIQFYSSSPYSSPFHMTNFLSYFVKYSGYEASFEVSTFLTLSQRAVPEDSSYLRRHAMSAGK